MRLICPNCGATYEVDASLIPPAGRDVQCSNCGHGWFQHPGDMETDADAPEADAPEAETPETGASARPRRRELDPEVADVLREEAEREAAARRAEKDSGLESQPDLGLDDSQDRAASRSAAARARMARLRGLDDADADSAKGQGAEVLPDVDEINSTLRGQNDRSEASAAPVALEVEQKRERRGFRAGFLLVVLLCAIAIAVYALAPRIGDMVPQARPYLAAYVDGVNDVRGQVNGLVETAVAKVRELTGGADG